MVKRVAQTALFLLLQLGAYSLVLAAAGAV